MTKTVEISEFSLTCRFAKCDGKDPGREPGHGYVRDPNYFKWNKLGKYIPLYCGEYKWTQRGVGYLCWVKLHNSGQGLRTDRPKQKLTALETARGWNIGRENVSHCNVQNLTMCKLFFKNFLGCVVAMTSGSKILLLRITGAYNRVSLSPLAMNWYCTCFVQTERDWVGIHSYVQKQVFNSKQVQHLQPVSSTMPIFTTNYHQKQGFNKQKILIVMVHISCSVVLEMRSQWKQISFLLRTGPTLISHRLVTANFY